MLLYMETTLAFTLTVLASCVLSFTAPSEVITVNQSHAAASAFHCPFTCLCYYKNASVSCISDYYSQIPELPYQIKKADFQRIKRLQNNAFNSCPYMESLTIGQGLGEVQPHSLSGLVRLQLFQIRRTVIHTVSDELFHDTANLTHLFLDSNKLRRIPDKPLCRIPRLVSLRLDRNHIDSMHFGGCFKFLRSLNSITMDYNRIADGHLRYTDLLNLANTSLEVLSIAACNISSISKNAFHSVTKLKTLYVNGNRLHAIPREALLPLLNLNEFFIGSNKITEINFSGVPFHNLTSLSLNLSKFPFLNYSSLSTIRDYPLRFLNLRQCQIQFISADAFEGFVYLDILDISMNNLNSTILHNLLLGLNDSRYTLQELHLGLNIKELNSDTFGASALQNLTVLSIGDQVSSIGDGTFRHFPYLAELSIKNCALRYFTKDAFGGLKRLKRLYLSNTFLTILPGLVLHHLEELDLSKNRVVGIYKRTFSYLEKLEVLLLKGNGLKDTDFTPSSFLHLRKLKRLDLSHNNIRGLLDRIPSTFHTLTALERLDLNANNIYRINRNVFANLTNLKMLNLARNNLWFREQDFRHLFSRLDALQMLSLESSGLSVIPVSMFSNLTNLALLYLGQNSITSWDPDAFRSLQKLHLISLSNNRISVINQTSFKWLKSLQVLDLSYNPFDCTCDLMWFRDWIEEDHVGLYFRYSYPFPKRHVYGCSSPNEMQGKSLFEFSIRPQDCIDNTVLTVMTWIAGSFIVVVLGISAVARYRWYFRYWCFLMKSRVKRYTEIHRRERYLFDAFVCYHVSDLQWIINELLPQVEYEHRFKVCLHHRNWVPGIDITENIVESIDKSRKTILVLTNNFACSRWCQLEASLAQHALLSDNRDVVILVMLEPIKSENMTAGLHSLLITKTYIEWTQDEKGQKLFWKRLRRALMKPEYEGNIEMT